MGSTANIQAPFGNPSFREQSPPQFYNEEKKNIRRSRIFQEEFEETGSFDSNNQYNMTNHFGGQQQQHNNDDEDKPISISFRNNILDQISSQYQQTVQQ